MAISEGKRFEQDFMDSCKKIEKLFVNRYKDGTSSWGSNNDSNIRFQATNICDFEVFYQSKLTLLELKSTLGASLPFGNIKTHQITDMTKAFETGAENLHVGFLINFRDHAETYYMSINQFNDFIENTDRKSIPIAYCRENCIKVNQIQKKVRYSYDVENFLDQLV